MVPTLIGERLAVIAADRRRPNATPGSRSDGLRPALTGTSPSDPIPPSRPRGAAPHRPAPMRAQTVPMTRVRRRAHGSRPRVRESSTDSPCPAAQRRQCRRSGGRQRELLGRPDAPGRPGAGPAPNDRRRSAAAGRAAPGATARRCAVARLSPERVVSSARLSGPAATRSTERDRLVEHPTHHLRSIPYIGSRLSTLLRLVHCRSTVRQQRAGTPHEPEHRSPTDSAPTDPGPSPRRSGDRHVVRSEAGQPDLLYIDLRLVHEVTSPRRSRVCAWPVTVRRPDLTVATEVDNVPTPTSTSRSRIRSRASRSTRYGSTPRVRRGRVPDGCSPRAGHRAHHRPGAGLTRCRA